MSYLVWNLTFTWEQPIQDRSNMNVRMCRVKDEPHIFGQYVEMDYELEEDDQVLFYIFLIDTSSGFPIVVSHGRVVSEDNKKAIREVEAFAQRYVTNIREQR